MYSFSYALGRDLVKQALMSEEKASPSRVARTVGYATDYGLKGGVLGALLGGAALGVPTLGALAVPGAAFGAAGGAGAGLVGGGLRGLVSSKPGKAKKEKAAPDKEEQSD